MSKWRAGALRFGSALDSQLTPTSQPWQTTMAQVQAQAAVHLKFKEMEIFSSHSDLSWSSDLGTLGRGRSPTDRLIILIGMTGGAVATNGVGNFRPSTRRHIPSPDMSDHNTQIGLQSSYFFVGTRESEIKNQIETTRMRSSPNLRRRDLFFRGINCGV